ncbi:CDP-alcohol phosphatidyltransferase family protein [Nigerium massiliense]|uniref:CDP-alcohol phosphatidyltransferase family protein n=1 Tax=Nigerium massiliense TaxID=1522317 RepID=UPI00058B96CF|nr:CDP-alcohol phosphatidyltransferase family protein [Nigerium massiliense]
MSDAQRYDAGWATIPNAFTVLRCLLLVPVCWLILQPVRGPEAIILLTIWAGTDWVDGWLARLTHQVSRFGEVLDPIADRVGIVAVLLCLAIQGLVSWWAFAVIAGVDVLTAVFAGRAAAGGQLRVNWLGKIRTAILFVALVLLVLASTWLPNVLPLGQALLWLGVALHVVAGLTYIVTARKVQPLAATRR